MKLKISQIIDSIRSHSKNRVTKDITLTPSNVTVGRVWLEQESTGAKLAFELPQLRALRDYLVENLE